MDQDSGRVLEGSNFESKKLIASTTKIMTAIIVLENMDIDKEIEVSKDVLKAYGSAIYIEVGEKITIKDLLYGLMLRSGNDAAIELAHHSFGSMEDFVNKMNEKAKSLGMNNTIFINNHGLEDDKGNGNLSTAYDMAILMKYALNNDIFREITKTDKHTVKTNYKTYIWHNKNKLLTSYKPCVGGKTGFTKKARRTLVTAAHKDDKKIIVVTLNDPNDFLDHKSLYESNFSKYKKVYVLRKKFFNVSNVDYNGTPYLKEDISLLVTKDEEKNISIEYEMIPNGKYNNDTKVGEVIVKLKDKEISRNPIYLKVKEEKKKKNFFQKILDFIIFWK